MSKKNEYGKKYSKIVFRFQHFMLEKLHNQTGTYPKQGGGSANHILGNQEYLS